MQRTANDIMLKDFPFVDCDVTVAEAQEVFDQGEYTALPVLNPDRTVFGLLTPSQIAAFYRRPYNNPRAVHAWEICDTRPLLGAAGDALRDVAAALLMAETHQALIIDEQRRLVGLITAEMLLEHEFSLAERATTEQAGRRPS